jgi:hypothetical protein
MRSRGAFALLAAACAGAAVWCSLGVIAVVSTRSGFMRVGFLPPLWVLPVLIVCLAGLSKMVSLSSRASLPLFLSLLLVLPWLPFRVPAAFLLWTAGMTAAVWIAVAIGMLAAGGVHAPAWLGDVRYAPRVAAVAALMLYLYAGFRLAEIAPNGDEPHYLVITQSLLKDRDLQIENNYTQGDYREYFRANLSPDFLRRGTNGQIYSIHAPGLPVAVVPAFALFGYHGVVIWLSLVAALGSALLWRASYQLTGSVAAAWFGWAAGSLTVPFFFQSFAVYPDALAATLVLFAVMPLLVPQPLILVKRWLGVGSALAVLPWLHTRFAVLSLAIALVLLLRLLQSPAWRSRVGALLAVPLVSALAWFGFFQAIYGSFNPSAPYGGDTQSTPANVLTGLPALFFDQQFGILPYAPVYGVCLAGLFVLVRRRPRFGLELLTIAVPYLLVASMFHVWWAGTVSPARFAVPVLPLLAIPGAWLWSDARRPSTRAMAAALLVLSLSITISLLVVDAGRLVYNFRDGFSLAAEQVSPVLDVPRGLPSFFRQTSAGAAGRGAIWLGVMCGAFLALKAIERRARREHRAILAFAAPALISVAVMIALTAVWKIDDVPEVTPETSQLNLLRSYNPRLRPLGVSFNPFAIQSAERVLSALAISTPTRRPAPQRMLLSVPSVIPAGRYELRPKKNVLRSGSNAKLFIGDSPRPAMTWDLSEALESGGLELNTSVDVGSIAVEGDEQSLRTGGLALHPKQLISRGTLVSTEVAQRAERYGPALVYFFDDGEYLEEAGFWSRGSAKSSVAVTSVTGAPVTLFLRNAPVRNTVSLAIGDRQQVLELAPREERTLPLQLSGNHATELIHLVSKAGFRPSEVEHGSTDARFLGVWIELRP